MASILILGIFPQCSLHLLGRSLDTEQDSVGWDASQNLYGSVDDVRIYDRALSQEEILQLYQGSGAVVSNPFF